MRPTSRQEAYATNEFSRELPRPQSKNLLNNFNVLIKYLFEFILKKFI